jgi:ribosomal protein S8
MKNVNYELILEKVLDVLKMEGLIDDWRTLNGNEIINIITQDKVYSFETKNNSKNIKITIDTLED